MALAAVVAVGPQPGDRVLVVSAHAHCLNTKSCPDETTICEVINRFEDSVSAVFVGGALCTQRVIADPLSTLCHMLPLNRTNDWLKGAPAATWPVRCPHGEPPRVASGGVRGDWLLAKGGGVAVDAVASVPAARLTEDGAHHCLSDHKILFMNSTFRIEETRRLL
eukprot:Selendium_serpulae@DN6265_c0_g1_i4.p2